MNPQGPNPSGLCQCGCGQPTMPAPQSDTKRGNVRGRPVRYVIGHNSRTGTTSIQWAEGTTGCWIWRGAVRPDGYGHVTHRGRAVPAHRYVYELHCGPIPEGLQLDHLCRNRACVNPEHLEPVTGQENRRRGLGTKLTRTEVAEIKKRARSGQTQASIAAAYGVAQPTVSRILGCKWWEDVA